MVVGPLTSLTSVTGVAVGERDVEVDQPIRPAVPESSVERNGNAEGSGGGD